LLILPEEIYLFKGFEGHFKKIKIYLRNLLTTSSNLKYNGFKKLEVRSDFVNKFSEYVNREALRRERFAKGFTAEHMAECLGKSSPSSYTNIENGIIEPKISDMVVISKVLEKPVGYFFNLELQDSQNSEQSA
jgi:DNA-binding XRE family transcriptional regulator